ncbi:unnamed protein product [Calypogeia fissa]
MKIPHESREDHHHGVSAKGNDCVFYGSGGKRKFWTVVATYAVLLTTISCVVLLFDSETRQDPFAMISLGHWWTPTSRHGLVTDHHTKDWRNILVEESSNYSTTLTSLLRANATIYSYCEGSSTNITKLEGLPNSANGKVSLQTDELHHLTLVAYDENGAKRCAGGDYYEVDLHDGENAYYRSRLPTKDFGNGSYGLELLVPSRFAGVFTLEIFILYGNWHGMEEETSPWAKKDLILSQELEMVVGENLDKFSKDSTIKQCTPADFDRSTWQGRWTRSWYNPTCEPEMWSLRYKCLPEEHYSCEEPWCFGPVGRLESNGWQYSAHCSFKIFDREEAWKCLDGKWFMMWGDSNFQDTVRNLLLFILEWSLPFPQKLSEFQLPRTYDMAVTNSHSYDQLFRVTQIFNGAHNLKDNGEGLNTLLRHREHQELLLAYFNGTKWPDAIVMNSGLHDAHAFPTIEEYVEAADSVIDFWTRIYDGLPADRRPRLIWRATVAPAGIGRDMSANPMKMEMFNQVMAERLQRVHDRLPVMFVDAFDLTFPFHYDNQFSDGGHYGRAPGVNLWPWHRKPHWYFVDIMLGHILLNAICPTSA